MLSNQIYVHIKTTLCKNEEIIFAFAATFDFGCFNNIVEKGGSDMFYIALR